MSMSEWIIITDMDSKHFLVFCNTKSTVNVGRRLESVTNSEAVFNLEKHVWLPYK